MTRKGRSIVEVRFRFRDVRDIIQIAPSTQVADGYLLHKWAPLLGGAQYIFVLVLREHAARARVVEQHNGIYQWPSIDELAVACGINRRTIERWFEETREAEARGDTPFLALFVSWHTEELRHAVRPDRFAGRTIIYEIEERTPLTPEDYLIYMGIDPAEHQAVLANPYIQGRDDLLARYARSAPVVESTPEGKMPKRQIVGEPPKRLSDVSVPKRQNEPRRQIVASESFPSLSTQSPTRYPQSSRQNVADPPLFPDNLSLPTSIDQDQDQIYEDQDQIRSDVVATQWRETVDEMLTQAFDRKSLYLVPFDRLRIFAPDHDTLRALLLDDFLEAFQDEPLPVISILHTAFTRVSNRLRRTDLATIDNPVTYYDSCVRQMLRLPHRTKA